MRALLLSDLHLGSPLANEDRVIDLLSSTDFDELYLVGDIIDSWEGNLSDIVDKHKRLIKLIEAHSKIKPVHYIMGNHDPKVVEVFRIFPLVRTYTEIAPLDNGVLIHGHQFDDLIMKHSKAIKFLFYFHWFFERLGINLKATFKELFCSIANKINKSYYPDLVLDVEKHIVKRYSSYEFVVAGHTHLPKIVKTDTVKYVNCGDQVHNKSYLTYDQGWFTLHT